jgi:hypothetical protein
VGTVWPEGESCQSGSGGTGRGGCIDGGSTGGCHVGNDNCNGGCKDNSRQQTTVNNRPVAKLCLSTTMTEEAVGQ